MRDYDSSFGIAAYQGKIFVGSSQDDSLVCIDQESGRLRWRFIADAPIRIASTIADQRIFFGSDDGFAYCLNAETGKLI